MFKLAIEKFKKKKKLGKRAVKRLILALVVLAVFSFTIGVSAVNYTKAANYKSQTADAIEECEQVKKDIQADSDLINGKGFDEYCEKIAREKYGYAKPGEYVIYDSSFN